MKNIGLIVQYEGTNFFGYQMQPNYRTVEEELTKALERATNEKINLISAGRTDKGVHSQGQVVNFYTRADIPAENYKKLMDFLLPGDISIKDSFYVDKDFHARFDAKKRKYKFVVYNQELPNAIYRNFSYHYKYKVDLEKMIEASRFLIGTHDFTSFKLSEAIDINPVRTIESIDIKRQDDFICFTVIGRSFLHNMVRIIVGTLLYVGSGKFRPEDVEIILNEKDRRKAGITVGAQGLYLEKVYY